jgi:multiple sugar transport system permease protein
MKKTSSLSRAKKFENLDLIVFMGPFLITFFTFTVLPVFVSLIIGFTNFNMLEMPDFVGLSNYSKLFLNDDIFALAIQNTMIIALVTGPISYLLCFAFAWLINEVPSKPRSFLTLLFYAPSLAGGFGFVWALLFSGDRYGYINGMLLQLGIITDPIQWTKDVKYMFPIAVIIILWQALGTTFLTFIAGLQTVDKSLYEAGAVDGIKNRWQELYFITLPSMRGQLMFGAILNITGSFGIGGTITAVFGFPTQDYKLHTIMSHLDDYGGIRFEMGYACAIATLLFILSLVANKVVQFILSRLGK